MVGDGGLPTDGPCRRHVWSKNSMWSGNDPNPFSSGGALLPTGDETSRIARLPVAWNVVVSSPVALFTTAMPLAPTYGMTAPYVISPSGSAICARAGPAVTRRATATNPASSVFIVHARSFTKSDWVPPGCLTRPIGEEARRRQTTPGDRHAMRGARLRSNSWVARFYPVNDAMHTRRSLAPTGAIGS